MAARHITARRHGARTDAKPSWASLLRTFDTSPLEGDAIANEGHVAVHVEPIDPHGGLFRLSVVHVDRDLAAILTAIILGDAEVRHSRYGVARVPLAHFCHPLIEW